MKTIDVTSAFALASTILIVASFLMNSTVIELDVLEDCPRSLSALCYINGCITITIRFTSFFVVCSSFLTIAFDMAAGRRVNVTHSFVMIGVLTTNIILTLIPSPKSSVAAPLCLEEEK